MLIERHLQRINTRFLTLRTVLEASRRVAATITVHHLLLNRNALFDGGLRPHHY